MNKTLLKGSGLVAVLIVAGFALAYQFVEPAPPQVLKLATGRPSGGYHAFGEAMRARLADSGIELELRATAGSGDNAVLLAQGAVDIALMQGGTPVAQIEGGERLRGLASLYYEPLWIFHRLDPAPVQLSELTGRRFNRGEPGSGTRQLVDEVLALNSVEGRAFTELDNTQAIAALGAGELDGLFVVGGETSPDIQSLLHMNDVALMDLPRASAYHLHRRYLSPLSLPAGAIDLKAERPVAERNMIGVTAMLVGREDLHPALVDLLLASAPSIVGDPGLFQEIGQFPSDRYLSIPLSREAQRFHRRGPSFLQRFLPFWAATLIDRLVVMLIPLAALVIPLVRMFPPVYRWRVRSRIYRWYGDLKQIEIQLETGKNEAEIRDAVARLDAEVQRLDTPLSYADEVYHLRSHIALVRSRVERTGLQP